MKQRFPKYLGTFLVLCLAILALQNCERDDICAESTPTTPILRIEFYDAIDPDVLKTVTRLTAYGEGLVLDDQGNEIQPVETSNATIAFNQNLNSIEIPLLIGDTENVPVTTRFVLEKDTNLRLNENPDDDSNVDILIITYVPQFEYVSRACGFKSIFTQVSVSIENDDDNWISSALLSPAISESQTIENENDVHVYLNH